MFNKEKFSFIIRNIKNIYDSQEEFSKNSNIGRTSLSQYMNCRLNKPPKPDILKKLANASKGITTYDELMEKGCDAVILACTEISVFKEYYQVPLNCVDAMDVLVREAIIRSGAKYLG